MGATLASSPKEMGENSDIIITMLPANQPVAGMTAAGIVAPLIEMDNVRPELMVLAIGAGSMTFSHVNDAGYWIYIEYFNLSIGKTIKTWSVMVTIISLIRLAGVLVLNTFIK